MAINPDHYNAAYARGACENKLGNFLKAIEDYDFALEKDKKLFHTPKRTSTNSPNRIPLPNSCKKGKIHNLSKHGTKGTPSILLGLHYDPSRRDSFNELIQKDESKSFSIENSLIKSSSAIGFEISSPEALSITSQISFEHTKTPIHFKPQSDAEKLYLLGYEAKMKGDYRNAIRLYTNAINLDPHRPEYYFSRAFVYDKLQEYLEAIVDYRMVVKLDPNNEFAYYNLGIAYISPFFLDDSQLDRKCMICSLMLASLTF